MPKAFDRYDYLKMKDMERCPYPMFTKECGEWNKKDDERLLIVALERYAEDLKTK
jgi:hypothetical protein